MLPQLESQASQSHTHSPNPSAKMALSSRSPSGHSCLFVHWGVCLCGMLIPVDPVEMVNPRHQLIIPMPTPDMPCPSSYPNFYPPKLRNPESAPILPINHTGSLQPIQNLCICLIQSKLLNESTGECPSWVRQRQKMSFKTQTHDNEFAS